MKRIAISALAVAVTLAAALASAEDFRWQGKVARGATIEIKGVNGGITATAASGDEVLVTAVKKGHKSDPSTVKVEVVEHTGGVTLCAVYPSDGGKPNVCAPGEGGHLGSRNNDVSVEFQVQVPEGVKLAARTVNGAISASGIQADASAETVNGGIKLESTGTAAAKTVNGSIVAQMGRADWQGALKLDTVNGGIEVRLPADASTEVKASTVNGDIDTDFPLTITGKIARRSISGTIGSGGRQLELATVNGGISLHKGGGKSAAR